MRNTVFITTLLLLCSNTLLAHSQKLDLSTDQQHALRIESNAFAYDNKTGLATYQGKVTAVQGSRKLRADTLEVFRNPAGDIEKLVAYGQPAEFSLQTTVDKTPLQGKAQHITYQQKTQWLYLQEQAELTQAADSYQAPLIEYNLRSEVIRSPQSATGRTRIVIQARS